jgi:hypothetical protein
MFMYVKGKLLQFMPKNCIITITMAVNVPELVKSIGLEELASITREEVATDFMPASIAGFADGDLYVMHEPYSDVKAELYGESHYSEGKVAKLMLKSALANEMKPGALYDFQGFAAEIFTYPTSPYSTQTASSAVHVHPEGVVVDNKPIALPRKPSLVIDYGACLTGRSYLADQMGFVRHGHRPFAYSPLTRLHFTNQVLINTYNSLFGHGTAEAFISNQLYIGREDGITSATNELIQGQRTHDAPTEVADVVICAGSQHSSNEDLQQGVANAHALLKEGGKLIIRSLAQPSENEIGTNDITAWAFGAGFEERNSLRYEAALTELGPLLMSGHFGERAIETVVLTK